jgi:hypothetical protein
MTTDIKKPSPNTLEDLQRMNFSFYIGIANEDQLRSQKAWFDDM